MVIVVSVKSKNNPAEATTTTLRIYVWGGLGWYLLQCHAKEGVLLSLCAWLYAQTRDLICFVCYSFFSLWWVLVWIRENPLCLHQRVVDWLWCMPVSPPTIINSNEDVPTHSSFPLRECCFPECQLQYMPITLTPFTLSAPLSSSLLTHLHTNFSLPVKMCSGKGSGNISYFHFHV